MVYCSVLYCTGTVLVLCVIVTLLQGGDVVKQCQIRHLSVFSSAGNVFRNLTPNWNELELTEERFVRS